MGDEIMEYPEWASLVLKHYPHAVFSCDKFKDNRIRALSEEDGQYVGRWVRLSDGQILVSLEVNGEDILDDPLPI